MATSIYITSAEGHVGKSTVALGVLDLLSREVQRVGVFRPIARSSTGRDYVVEMLLEHVADQAVEGPAYEDCIGVTYDDVHADGEAALSRIVERYKAIEARSDAVVVLGSDYTDVGTPTELSYNARVAANLGAAVLLVLNGRDMNGTEQLGQAPPRSSDHVRQIAEVAVQELRSAHTTLLAVVVNRADPASATATVDAVTSAVPQGVPVWTIPEDPYLIAPSMASVAASVDGGLVTGERALLAREVLGVVVAGMSMVNVLPRLTDGAVVIVPGAGPTSSWRWRPRTPPVATRR